MYILTKSLSQHKNTDAILMYALFLWSQYEAGLNCFYTVKKQLLRKIHHVLDVFVKAIYLSAQYRSNPFVSVKTSQTIGSISSPAAVCFS